jgi:hypothetical protein
MIARYLGGTAGFIVVPAPALEFADREGHPSCH